MTDIPASRRVRAIPEQVSSRTDREFVILNVETGKYHGVTGVAAHIWSMLQDGATVAEIEESVSQAFAVDRPRCHEDVQAFLGELRARGLVEIEDVGSS